MLITKAAYARYKGVSRQTVYDWIKKGELVLVGAKIDVSATEQKTANTDIPAAWQDDNKLVNISPKATLFSKDEDYSQEKYHSIQAGPDEAAAMCWRSMTFLRWLVVTKRFDDADLRNVTKAGLAALAEPFITSAADVYRERFYFLDEET